MTHKQAIEHAKRFRGPGELCIATSTENSKDWLERRLRDDEIVARVLSFGSQTYGRRFSAILVVDEDEISSTTLFTQWVNSSIKTRLVLGGQFLR